MTKSDLVHVWSYMRHAGVQCLSVEKIVEFKDFFCSLNQKPLYCGSSSMLHPGSWLSELNEE